MPLISGFQKLRWVFRRLVNLRLSGSAQGQIFYDHLYDTEVEYRVDFRDSFYLAVWGQVYRFLRQIPQARVLEIGCGSGQFADFLRTMGFTDYLHGFDLSSHAVEMARRRAPFSFGSGSAHDPALYAGDYNTVIALEVLEHIPDDLAVLKNIRPGTFLIVSLPDFEYESHRRWFTSPRQIEKRYYRDIALRQIVKVGRWYVLFGTVDPIVPSFFQRWFKTRGPVNTIYFCNKYLRPAAAMVVRPLIRALFSR